MSKQTLMPKICISEWSTYTCEDLRIQRLKGEEITKAFIKTAKVLDEIEWQSLEARQDIEIKKHELYHGLLWLQKKAKKEGVILWEEMLRHKKIDDNNFAVWVFNPFEVVWVKEILSA